MNIGAPRSIRRRNGSTGLRKLRRSMSSTSPQTVVRSSQQSAEMWRTSLNHVSKLLYLLVLEYLLREVLVLVLEYLPREVRAGRRYIPATRPAPPTCRCIPATPRNRSLFRIAGRSMIAGRSIRGSTNRRGSYGGRDPTEGGIHLRTGEGATEGGILRRQGSRGSAPCPPEGEKYHLLTWELELRLLLPQQTNDSFS